MGICLLALPLGGCGDLFSVLAASGLTGWLTNRDGCTVRTETLRGSEGGTVTQETRICTETSILPKGLREYFAPAPPVPGSPPVPPPEKM